MPLSGITPGSTHPSCSVTVIPISQTEKQVPRDQNLTLGKGWCAPRGFLRYLHPWGPEGSLSAPTDMNFCLVGSDGPISGHWPTTVAATPYQTPSRPHLSPGQGSQRGLLDSYLAGEARASDVAAGLCWGQAGLVSPRALPGSGHLGDVGAAHALLPLSPGTLHKSKALSPVLCPSKPFCLSSVNVSPSLSLSPRFDPWPTASPLSPNVGESAAPPLPATCEASLGTPPTFPLWSGGNSLDHSVPHAVCLWASDWVRASVSHLVGAGHYTEPMLAAPSSFWLPSGPEPGNTSPGERPGFSAPLCSCTVGIPGLPCLQWSGPREQMGTRTPKRPQAEGRPSRPSLPRRPSTQTEVNSWMCKGSKHCK